MHDDTKHLNGLHFLLCRNQDVLRINGLDGPCCRNASYFMNGKLWCADCKRGRGRLPPDAIEFITHMLKVYPEEAVGTAGNPIVLREKPDDDEPAADSVA